MYVSVCLSVSVCVKLTFVPLLFCLPSFCPATRSREALLSLRHWSEAWLLFKASGQLDPAIQPEILLACSVVRVRPPIPSAAACRTLELTDSRRRTFNDGGGFELLAHRRRDV